MGFDFGRISDVISKVVDTDYIDIQRDVGGSLQEVYSNIPCHVAYSSVDNPDPNSVDIKPIIQSLTIHVQNWVDVRNNDFIIAKKVGSDGKLIAVYSGRCGNPVVSQGRKKILVTMSATEPEEPTPLPPKKSVIVTVLCVSGADEIKKTEIEAEAGEPLLVMPPEIDGYSVLDCWIDGEQQDGSEAYIDEVSSEGNTVLFTYATASNPMYFRFLVNGLYTKDDGGLAKGWHQYKKTGIDSIVFVGETYTITSNDVNYVHEDNGKKLSVQVGTKLVLVPGDIFAEMTEILERGSGKVSFVATPYVPTEAELNSYVCGWY